MTDRLYYTDSGLTSFDARVVSCVPVSEGRFEAYLDRTAFYPASGGQPFDTGRIGDVHVVDVQDDEDGRIVHVVDGPLVAGVLVTGTIDRPRRLDHMQQHTGQHILSAAFDRLHGVRTVSFHMGTDASTIDLTRDVTPSEIAAAEDEANRVVWEDWPVTVRFATDDEAKALPLRKESARTGTLRLVEVTGFDLSACGGTHVPRTGVVGLIAVSGTERFKGGTRLTFVCGGRALRSHRGLRDVVGAATKALSTGAVELPAAVERLQAEARDAAKARRKLQETVAGYRGVELRSTAEAIGRHLAVVRYEPDLDAGGLKGLAAATVSGTSMVVVLAGAGAPAPLVVACGGEADLDAGAFMKTLAAALGGRGGGSRELAQGGVQASAERALDQARMLLVM